MALNVYCSYNIATMKAVLKKSISMQMEGFEVIEKVAESSGNSGRIYVPKKWIGKKVRAVLIE